MFFNKSPDNLFSAVFNVLQGATMTITVSLYLGQTAPAGLIKTFVCAYCAGVMLMQYLRVPAFGNWIAKMLHCDKNPVAAYLVSNAAAGGLMGIFMNFFMTFMNMGPVPGLLGAFLHTLLFSIVVSAISSCLWIGLTQKLVGAVYKKTPQG